MQEVCDTFLLESAVRIMTWDIKMELKFCNLRLFL